MGSFDYEIILCVFYLLAFMFRGVSRIPGYHFTKALTQIVKLRNYFLL